MKRCAYCGRENPDGAIRCQECGTDESTPTAPPTLSAADKLELETEPPDPEPFESEDEPAMLCPYCVFPNSPDASWCRKCGSPVNYGAIVGPADAARATIFVWLGALRGRPKLFVLLTIWLFFLPAFVVNLFGTLGLVVQILTGQAHPVSVLVLCWSATFGGAAFLMLYRITRNFFTVPKIILED
jgi:ribosomal protein L40E